MTRTALVFRLLLMVLLGAALTTAAGCKGKSTPSKAAMEKPKPAASAPPPAVKEEPKVEKEVYVYEQKGRRDPFV